MSSRYTLSDEEKAALRVQIRALPPMPEDSLKRVAHAWMVAREDRRREAKASRQ